jgi:flagellar M-ring protein FliF
LVKYVALLVGLVVVLAFGVRPALKLARTASVDAGRAGGRELPRQAAAPPGLNPPEAAPPDPERLKAQEIFEQVSGQLKREPAQSSRLLQSWIHSD